MIAEEFPGLFTWNDLVSLDESLDLRDLNFLVLKAEKKILMRKRDRIRETALATSGGNQLNDELTSIHIALRQIAREEDGLPPVQE